MFKLILAWCIVISPFVVLFLIEPRSFLFIIALAIFCSAIIWAFGTITGRL